MAAAVVRLKQHADRKPLAGQLYNARRRPDSAFEVEELGTGTGANASFLNRPVLRGIQRGVDFLARDSEGTAVA